MSRNNSWSWQRRVPESAADEWIARLEQAGCATWTATQRPGSRTVLLAVYSAKKSEVAALHKLFGGQLRSIAREKWLPSRPTPPTRIGKKLEIVHDAKPGPRRGIPRLRIPHGVAFGSGEHGTTYMLLRALVQEGDLSATRVLDLGTGSGVLALAARLFGARKITATDFDPDSVRTSRQNEALNFRLPTVQWRRADVKQLSSTAKYDLVLANLFSGILIEAAPRIARAVAPNGRLWLSGILATQSREVSSTYRRQGLRLAKEHRRGKWVMQQWGW